MIKIGLCGASGRMGQAILQIASKEQNQYKIVAEFNSSKNYDKLKEFCNHSEIVIDFSNKSILQLLLEHAQIHSKPLVIGTTGFSEKDLQLIQDASLNIAIIYSANMSLGANLVAALAVKAAKILDSKYDIEVLDMHHRFKMDSPSGTALMYGQLLADARKIPFVSNNPFVSNKDNGYTQNQVNITSIRAGEIIGEHQIMFAGDNEVITLKHQAQDRKIFAQGALKAAQWLINKQAGLYSMFDMLGLENFNS